MSKLVLLLTLVAIILIIKPSPAAGTRFAIAYGGLGWTCTQNPGNEC